MGSLGKYLNLGEGYIDHRARVAEVTSSSAPGEESWWSGVPVTDDICHFLLVRLTSPETLQAPMILLGQPGSGKSVLTRILAARLSAAGFLAVRVELRQAPQQRICRSRSSLQFAELREKGSSGHNWLHRMIDFSPF